MEQEATEQAKASNAQKLKLEDRIAEQERRLDSYSAVGRWVLGGCLILFGVALPATLIPLGILSGVWPVTAICLAAIGLAVLGFSIGLTLKFARILGGAALVLGLVAAVLEIAHAVIG